MALTRSKLSELLKQRGITPRKSLGQNFLVDSNFLEAMVRDAGIGPRDGVIEIGSGTGHLTGALAARADHVWAFEIDPALHRLSIELLQGTAKVTFLNEDGGDFERHIDPGAAERWKIVSNLPYSSWERLVLRMLSTRLSVESYTLMIQADVYERLRAKPGTKAYGPLPALLQGGCEMKRVRRAGKGLFLPAPNVHSVVFQLRRKDPSLDFEKAADRLRSLFRERRKKSPLAGGRRIEQVTPSELLSLL